MTVSILQWNLWIVLHLGSCKSELLSGFYMLVIYSIQYVDGRQLWLQNCKQSLHVRRIYVWSAWLKHTVHYIFIVKPVSISTLCTVNATSYSGTACDDVSDRIWPLLLILRILKNINFWLLVYAAVHVYRVTLFYCHICSTESYWFWTPSYIKWNTSPKRSCVFGNENII